MRHAQPSVDLLALPHQVWERPMPPPRLRAPLKRTAASSAFSGVAQERDHPAASERHALERVLATRVQARYQPVFQKSEEGVGGG
jgi:hypothetical protein